MSEVELLARAHALFGGAPAPWSPDGGHSPGTAAAGQSGAAASAFRAAAGLLLEELDEARRTDRELTDILHAARRDHSTGRRDTGAVLTAARADAQTVPASPMAARELMRRRVIRLRNQRAHLLAARAAARRHRAELGLLRYRLGGAGHGPGGGGPRAQAAVRAALSRLGRPYVWGATGPDRFDCSGLVQWAYARAGVRLDRTTYQQIHEGLAVPRSGVQPGDLVFPHRGHVQMAIGGGLVVEAPQPGATVRISRLGPSVAIRRPV